MLTKNQSLPSMSLLPSLFFTRATRGGESSSSPVLLYPKTTIILSNLSPPSLRDQSRSYTRKTLLDGHSRHISSAFLRCTALLELWSLLFRLSKFLDAGILCFPALSHSSPIPCVSERWQLSNGLSRVEHNWKAWLLAAGGATICESEWFGECCVRGRGGRGLRESQTAIRGELLTPHRCQKAPRWPFAEPTLQIRKRVIIPLWDKYKHVLLWILSTLTRRNTAEVWRKHQYLKSVLHKHSDQITVAVFYQQNVCKYNCRWKIYYLWKNN